MLPINVELVKGKSTSAFGGLFGEKSVDFAIELLIKALKSESDAKVRTELERRLKLLEPKQSGTVECSECKRRFQPSKIKKCKQYYCRDCLKKRFGKKY
jgi:hypothetical protein